MGFALRSTLGLITLTLVKECYPCCLAATVVWVGLPVTPADGCPLMGALQGTWHTPSWTDAVTLLLLAELIIPAVSAVEADPRFLHTPVCLVVPVQAR